MAGELVSLGIQNLWDLLSHEYEQFKGVEDQVNELKTDINKLKSFLEDAYAKKHESEVVKDYLVKINEIIFDAEDILETFILKEELGKQGGIKKRIKRLACIFPERREIALEIGGISKRISKVVRDMETSGVQRTIADAKDPRPLQRKTEFDKKYESNLVGLEENVKKLVGYLVKEDDIQVVSMTGMGGLGKTTLARQAFNHEMVKSKFDRLVWVCVSQDCDHMNVWKTILRTLRPNDDKKISKMTESTLQGELFQLLGTFKSLIVFDDIWKEEHWSQIKDIFPWEKGSKVLFTSRNERVAGRGERCVNFKPECLSDQDSWELFQRILMSSKTASELENAEKEMEEMGKQMIKHCQGFPLAIIVLGSLLAEKYTFRDWNRLSKDIGPHLFRRTNDDNDINRVLSLSYEELPGYLKYCFLYLAHFPEDYEINVEDLSYFWAAEGILRYNDGETILDVGDTYIEELVRRNMVIAERDDTTSSFKTCCLHDLMRELCLYKAKEQNFLQTIGIPSPTAHSQSVSTSRRFVSQNPLTLDIEREINNSKVRSLMVVRLDKWHRYISSISFTRLQLLRVLHLPGVDFKEGKLPYSIGKLIHLRYLNLEDANLLDHLPSLENLKNLKSLIYLNLNSYGLWIFVPNVLMGMKELIYLALPKAMEKKVKLELSHLVNLETLKNFSTEICNLEDLREMSRLRTLQIVLRGESSLETLSASISGLRHMENLSVDYYVDKGTKEWRTLFEFNNFQQLELNIRTTLLSNELEFPSSLTCLSLEECGLEEDPMPILEKLGQLKEVRLKWKSFCGRRMVCSGGGFPQLHMLEFYGLCDWKEWIIEEGSMPFLHTLTINHCKRLKELPDGLRFITSLSDLSISHMGKEWKEALSEGGKDYYKVKHITRIAFYDPL